MLVGAVIVGSGKSANPMGFDERRFAREECRRQHWLKREMYRRESAHLQVPFTGDLGSLFP